MHTVVEVREYPRKGSEYCVWIKDDEGKPVVLAYPLTPYEAEVRMVKRAFDLLLSQPDGEEYIRQIRSELP